MLTTVLARVALVITVTCLASAAFAETRTLRLQHVHSREKAEIVYKKDGRFLPAGLQAANRILRDWRTQDVIAIDPRLLDVVWEVYRQTGATSYVQVIGGHRSNRTNEILRSRSSGVAKGSLHTHGKAIDLFIPGVPLKSVRDAGLRVQAGGVGYYPSSGSPFVHLDVGGVRHWPRLAPTEYAAIIKNATPMAGASTQIASLDEEAGDRAEMSFLQRLFGRAPRSAPAAPVAVAQATPSSPRSAPVAVSAARPAGMESDFDTSAPPATRVASLPDPAPVHELPRRGPVPTFAVRTALVDDAIVVAEASVLPADPETIKATAADDLVMTAVVAYGQNRMESRSRFDDLLNRHPLRDAERSQPSTPPPTTLPLWTGALKGLDDRWVVITTAQVPPEMLTQSPDLILREGFTQRPLEAERRFSGHAVQFLPILRAPRAANGSYTASEKGPRLANRFASTPAKATEITPFAHAILAGNTPEGDTGR